MRAKLVVGNWKMHGSLSDNAKLLSELIAGIPGSIAASVGSRRRGTAGAQQAVCVPFPYLDQARQSLTGTPLAWGAQNVSQHAKGAYTGEVSTAMLRDFGCTYVIVGHSERRALYGEDSDTVALKYKAVADVGLTPILCVGETLDQREFGETERVVDEQLRAVTARFGVQALASGVVAYEPVWAIGTGKTAAPEQAQAVHSHIRGAVAREDFALADGLRILYGGSVKASNAKALFAMPDIDGGLIGGASLIAVEFLAICTAAQG
jgi:triosephosphate isomerase (TIM)